MQINNKLSQHLEVSMLLSKTRGALETHATRFARWWSAGEQFSRLLGLEAPMPRRGAYPRGAIWEVVGRSVHVQVVVVAAVIIAVL